VVHERSPAGWLAGAGCTKKRATGHREQPFGPEWLPDSPRLGGASAHSHLSLEKTTRSYSYPELGIGIGLGKMERGIEKLNQPNKRNQNRQPAAKKKEKTVKTSRPRINKKKFASSVVLLRYCIRPFGLNKEAS